MRSDERIDEGVLGGSAMWREWRMIGLLRIYVGEYAGSRSVGRSLKR